MLKLIESSGQYPLFLTPACQFVNIKAMNFSVNEKNCPLCEKESTFSFIMDFSNPDGDFSLYACAVCGGQFWAPFKNPGSEWYEKQDNFNVKQDFKPRPLHSYHKEFLARNGGRLAGVSTLDIGCGTGEFVNELKKRGAVACGVDIDREAISIAKKFFAAENYHNLPAEDFLKAYGSSKYGLITLFEVFEHIDKPMVILRAAREMLIENGKLCLSTPTRQRPLVNSAAWDFPYHHLSRWDGTSISNLLKEAGFSEIKIAYINRFGQLNELFLEILAKTLKFKKGRALAGVESVNSAEQPPDTFKKTINKIIYRAGRFVGVVFMPYVLAAIFYPVSAIFYPHSGIMYIEARRQE